MVNLQTPRKRIAFLVPGQKQKGLMPPKDTRLRLFHLTNVTSPGLAGITHDRNPVRDESQISPGETHWLSEGDALRNTYSPVYSR